MQPPRESVRSSSCRLSTPPHSRWYCIALRSIPALATGRPSSVKPSAPSARRYAISVSSSPRWPEVIAAMNPTGMHASRAAASRSDPSSGAESITGSVFGIAITAPKPPAAAARVPLRKSSLCSWPGLRRCTCGSKKAGASSRPCPLTSSISSSGSPSEPASASAAILPSRTSTSRQASSRARGSSTRTSRSSSWAGGYRPCESVSAAITSTEARAGDPRPVGARHACPLNRETLAPPDR